MNIEQALELANDALSQSMGRNLSDVETLILKGSWERQTYEIIAENSNYSANYLRKDVGPKLWRDLTAALEEAISKTSFRAALERQWHQKQQGIIPQIPVLPREYYANRQADWGDVLDVSIFFGRTEEQETLSHWIISDRCRLIVLLGMGGIGKTALSIKVGQQVQSDFEFVIWRSLRNAPPLLELLSDITQFIAQKSDLDPPKDQEAGISRLLKFLREHRCLLILDNAEVLLKGGDRDRSYRSGCEGYHQLFQGVGETQHLSCLILTSRELPQGLGAKTGQALPMRSLMLTGLSPSAGQRLLGSIGSFHASPADWQSVIERYAGNPLALRIMASFVREVFSGDLEQCLQFIGESSFIFDDIRDLLTQQFQRLSPQEQAVMIWLAIKRTPIMIEELPEDLVPSLPLHELLQVLTALQSRALIERNEHYFTQQPVVMEYVTLYFIDKISEQIRHWQSNDPLENLQFLQQYAMVQVQAKDYIQDTQKRLIVQPILDHLMTQFGQVPRIEKHVKQILQALKGAPPQVTGYSAGNIINLLRRLYVDLSAYDFSEQTVWQADLQGLVLYDVNLAQADLSKSRFSKILGWGIAVAFSPNGEYLATGDNTGSIHLWSCQTEQHQLGFRAHQGHVWSMAYSPNSQWVVSGSLDGTVKLWDIKNGQCLWTLTHNDKMVLSVAFSHDSERFASSSNDGTIKIWNCSRGECLQSLAVHQSPIRSITFTPDQNVLISGGEDHQVRLWDITQGKCIQTLEGHTQSIRSVDVSTDGTLIVSAGDDCLIKVWSLQSGACLETFEGHSMLIWSVAFSPDGQTVASGSVDKTVRLWSLKEKKCSASLQGHNSWVFCVEFSPDGTLLASGGIDQTIKLWNVSQKVCASTWSGYQNIVWALGFQPNQPLEDNQLGTIASGSIDGVIRFWNLTNGQCIRSIRHPTEVHTISFSPDGKRLVSGSINENTPIQVWDVESGSRLSSLPIHATVVKAVRFSHDGSLIAVDGGDKMIYLFQEMGNQIHALQGHEDVVWSIAWSPNDQWLASGSFDQTIRIWDIRSGQCVKTLSGHINAVFSVAFHPSGSILATGSAEVVKLWFLETGECYQTLTEHSNLVMCIAFTPDGQHFVTGSFDKTIRIWQTESGECLQTLQIGVSVYSIAISHDGKLLIGGGDDGSIHVWNIKTTTRLNVIRLPKPYAGMNIRGMTGVTEAQKGMLVTLGAIEC